MVTKRELGATGLDINSDHLALVGLDRFGNFIQGQCLSCSTYGLSTDQAKAKIGYIAKQLLALLLAIA